MKRSVVGMVMVVVGMAGMVSADWESDANARIEQNRKRDATITVVDRDGTPIGGVTVNLRQVRHRFGFGSAIETSSNDTYFDYFRDTFEWAVFENKLKWAQNEPTQGTYDYSGADTLTRFCLTNGIKVRGHTVFWSNSVPSWASSLSNTALQAAMSDRVDSVVNRYEGKVEHWDVHNELLDDDFFEDKFGSSIHDWMFDEVRDEDPNVQLFLNEYDTEPSGNFWFDLYVSYRANRYISKIQSLVNSGADVGGIGLQCHINDIDPSAFKSRLDEYAAFNVPIWITEYDCDASSAADRADIMEDTFRVAFSHSSVEGILVWGFWSEKMSKPVSALYDANWNVTTVGQRYFDLMDEWTTDVDDVTDTSGEVSFRGFHGIYEVSMSKNGENLGTQTIELDPGTSAAAYTLASPVFADDFEDGVVDTAIWDLSSNLGGTISESSGKLTLTSAGSSSPAIIYGQDTVCPLADGTVTLQSTGLNLGYYQKKNTWGLKGAEGASCYLMLYVDDGNGVVNVKMKQTNENSQTFSLGVGDLDVSLPYSIDWSLDRVVVRRANAVVFDSDTNTVDDAGVAWRIPSGVMVAYARSGYNSNSLSFEDMEIHSTGEVLWDCSDACSDDFEDASLDGSLWDTTMNNGTIVESNGELTLSSNGSANRAILISAMGFKPNAGTVVLRSSGLDFGYYMKDNRWGFSTANGQNYIKLQTDPSSGCLHVYMRKDGGTSQRTGTYVLAGNRLSGSFSIMWQTGRVRVWKGASVIFDSATMLDANNAAWNIPVAPLSIYALTGYNSNSIVMEDVQVLIADEAEVVQ